LLVYPPGSENPGDWRVAVATGVAIALLALPLEIFSRELPMMVWIRSRPAPLNWFLRSLLHLTVIFFALLGTQFLFDALIYRRAIFSTISVSETTQDAIFSSMVLLLVVFVLEMRALLGGKVVANTFLGRYAAPREEQRIFLLVDMVGSSAIAASLGDKRYHGFLDETFRLAERTIAEEGGEIYTFIGDAMIASWPIGAPERNAAPLNALLRLYRDLDLTGPMFEQSYGFRPKLRAVLHGGPVVIGEYGEVRRQVTYLGEVLNVTSRLERFAKVSGLEILISKSLLDKTGLTAGLTAAPVPVQHLQHWRGNVEILVLYRRDAATEPPHFAVNAARQTGSPGVSK
jgi:adenylate cyclase